VLNEDASRSTGVIWTTQKFGDVEWTLDFQVPERADLSKPWAAFHVRGSALPAVVLGTSGGGLVSLEPGMFTTKSWHRLMIKTKGRVMSVNLDGKVVAPQVQLPTEFSKPGPLGLADLGHAINLANLYWVRAR
jgi:hypothetical protein